MTTRRSARARYPRDIDLATELEIAKQVETTEEKVMKRLDESVVRFETVTHEMREKQTSDRAYLTESVQTVERNLTEKIETETKRLTAHFDSAIAKLDAKWSQQVQELETRDRNIEKRVGMLENWRWLLVGGGVVVLWIVSQIILDKIVHTPQ